MDRADAERLLGRLHAAQNVMYAGGDDEPVRALMTEDIEWTVPGSNAIAGRYRGHAEVLGYFRHRRTLAAGTLRLHPGELLVGDGEHLAVLTDGTAGIDGIEHRWSTIGLYAVRGGRIARCRLLPLDQAAFDRVWSPSAVVEGDADVVEGAAQLTIRAATSRDIPAVLGLWEQARSAAAATPDDPAGVSALVEQRSTTLLVAERDGEVVGALIAAWDGWRGNMYRLAVLARFRRQGIARRLVEAGHARLRSAGARRITALVGSDDEPAAALWRSAGYARDEQIARFVRNL